MSKVFGSKSIYAPVRSDKTRIIVSYEYQEEPDGENATWQEIVFYKKINPTVDKGTIKKAILNDINQQTEEKIVTGLTWEGMNVWLSTENQLNFKASYDRAVQKAGATLPVTFKIGEDAEGKPFYHTFDTMAEFEDFSDKIDEHRQACLTEGNQRKDAIDWTAYGIEEK